jgi:glycerol-3-phosphate dehydrogenase
VFDHEAQDGVGGFLSIAGGKLASYRLMSEEAVDLVCQKLGKMVPCRTHIVPLPGGERVLEPELVAQAYQVPLLAAERLIFRHGSRAEKVLELTKEHSVFRNMICQCEPTLEAELRFAVRNEWAKTLADLRRRTRFSTGPCQATRCLTMTAQILGEELGLSPREILHQMKEFNEKSYEKRIPVLNGTALQQEELLAHSFSNVGNLF